MAYITVCLDHALSRCLVHMNLKMIVSKVIVQYPERQRVEDFGVLRGDAV
jgi:hypothetical protein